jgi:hypothetical protein
MNLKDKVSRILAAGVLTVGAAMPIAIAQVALAPAAHAEWCTNGNAPAAAWGGCDYPPDPDGSHMHCDTVYVFGYGGTNCFRVFP